MESQDLSLGSLPDLVAADRLDGERSRRLDPSKPGHLADEAIDHPLELRAAQRRGGLSRAHRRFAAGIAATASQE